MILPRLSLTAWILTSAILGIATGLFFGTLCSVLSPLTRTFISIWQITVLPSVAVALIVGVGSLRRDTAKTFMIKAAMVILLLWTIAVVGYFAFQLAFPPRMDASFFSTEALADRPGIDFTGQFIPANPFASLADGIIPATVIFCLLLGFALMMDDGSQQVPKSVMAEWSRFPPDIKSAQSGAFSTLALDARGNPRSVYLDESNHIRYIYGTLPLMETGDLVNETYLVRTPTPTVTVTPAPEGTLPEKDPGVGNLAEVRPINPPGREDLLTQSPPVNPSGTSYMSAKAMPAGQEVTYRLDTPSAGADALAVQTVSLTPDADVPASVAYVRQADPPITSRIQDRQAIYTEIGISGIDHQDFRQATIAFSVTKTWLDENHIGKDDVNLMRLHDGAWAHLPTTFARGESGRYYYTATTPGFSFFAVTGGPAAARFAKTSPEVTATPVPTHTSAPAVTTTQAKKYVKAKAGTITPEPTPTMPVTEPDKTVPYSGLPVFWIAVAALISLLGVAGFLTARHLWRVYQNPALFRKYD